MMECKYNHDEFCVNDQCPMCADYCPVPDTDGVCKYEDREEEVYMLTPNGYAIAAFAEAGIEATQDEFDEFWRIFSELMTKFGYVKED